MIGWERVAGRLTWLALWLCLWPSAAMAGRLESVRSEVRGDSDSDSDWSSSSSSSSDDDYDYDYDYDDDDPTYDPSDASGPSAPAPQMRFHSFPYQDGASGYLFARTRGGDEGRHRAGQIWLEGAWQGRGLWRSGGGLRYDGQIIGLDGDLSYYLEPAANDALYLGTANLSLIPLHARRGLWRIGGGINTMIDGRVPWEGRREYALGWNITTSVDLFPAFPVVVSMRADVGRLHQAIMGRLRGSVGVMLGRMELYGGYEQTYVGQVGLGGPTVGLRLWL